VVEPTELEPATPIVTVRSATDLMGSESEFLTGR
jgi:hypothetical protein